MGSFSIWHWIIVLGLVLVLFGRGKSFRTDGRRRQGHQDRSRRAWPRTTNPSPARSSTSTSNRSSRRPRRRIGSSRPARTATSAEPAPSRAGGAAFMFDIGWSEILVIAVVAIVVVGPKDLPRMLRTFGKTMGTVRRTANDFKRQFDDALREAEREVDLADTRKELQALVGDPLAETKKDFDKTMRDAAKPALDRSLLGDARHGGRAAGRSVRRSGHPAGPADQGRRGRCGREAGCRDATRHDRRRYRGVEGAAARPSDRAAPAADARDDRDLRSPSSSASISPATSSTS